MDQGPVRTMRGNLDFTSWNGVLSTLLGLVLVSVIAIGIRLVFMQTLQRRRERENRQINERLKTLIAAYKVLGGSFTGELRVDPSHLRDQRRQGDTRSAEARVGLDAAADEPDSSIAPPSAGSDRRRRIRDAVEAALADVILLGTEEQVRLAAKAASDMVAGHPIQTRDLVVSLRDFIREALDLEPIGDDLSLPDQGPLRIANGGARKGNAGGEAASRGGSGGGSGGGMGGGAGMGLGAGVGIGAGAGLRDQTSPGGLGAADEADR